MSLPSFWVDVDLADHPKVHDLARRLRRRRPEVIGYLILAWTYCYRQVLSSLPADVIEEVALWKGKRGALVEAMLGARLLDEPPGGVEGTYIVHGIEERLSHHVEAKKKHAQRQQRYRDRKAGGDASRDGHVTRLDREGDVDGEGDREENTSSPPASPAAAGDSASLENIYKTALAQVWKKARETTREVRVKDGPYTSHVEYVTDTPDYVPHRRDEKAIQKLIEITAGKVTEAERRFEIALKKTFPACSNIYELVEKWNDYAADTAKPKKSQWSP